MRLLIRSVLCVVLVFISYSPSLYAQEYFPDKCAGIWEGMMIISRSGVKPDSVNVRFTAAKISGTNSWTWKTEYLSSKMPVVKDYLLRLKDEDKNIYVLDEGDNIELMNYLHGNKLYSLFETQDIFLTSTYELTGKELIFEVTAGKKLNDASRVEVINYSVTTSQRVVLHKTN